MEAAYLIRRMTAHRPELLGALADARVRFSVMAFDERTTDIPEHSDLTPAKYWDRRARGLGATAARPSVSCGEENLLGYPRRPVLRRRTSSSTSSPTRSTRWRSARVDRGVRSQRLRGDLLRRRWRLGLWEGTCTPRHELRGEYWAEGVQSWFDTNRENDDQHNHVDTRAELVEYDPKLAALCKEVFGDTPWRYVHPRDREEPGHLTGLDATQAPRFEWSEELEVWYRENGHGGRK